MLLHNLEVREHHGAPAFFTYENSLKNVIPNGFYTEDHEKKNEASLFFFSSVLSHIFKLRGQRYKRRAANI